MRAIALVLFVGSLWLSACSGTPEDNGGTTNPGGMPPDNDMQRDTTMLDTTMQDNTR